MLDYGEHGEVESMLARAYVADAVADVAHAHARPRARRGASTPTRSRRRCRSSPRTARPSSSRRSASSRAKHGTGPTHLSDDFELVAETFRRFAEDKIRPVAEHVHRTNADVPEEIIGGLAELGGFGLSVPEEYGGFATGGEHDYIGMVVATEELSWGSLGIGGSLITRPEILTRALVAGGTEEQKQRWLPRIATGELMVGVMVTEPDYGSDVAGVKVTADPVDGGYVVNGVKTWATFAGRADVLMLLARTDPDRIAGPPRAVGVRRREAARRGPRVRVRRRPRRQDGRPRDRHDRLPRHALLRGRVRRLVRARREPRSAATAGSAGASTSRWRASRTAGCRPRRAPSASCRPRSKPGSPYAQERKVFGKPVFDYQLSQVKLARMAALIQAGRQFSYDVARKMAAGEGTLEASMVKAYVCRAAEWVTREAMQLHGGMGYAEEFPVSRYFVDARVLSIFEGADETLCLRVIARRLAEQALG